MPLLLFWPSIATEVRTFCYDYPMTIKHIWFDFSETIARINTEEHDRLKYATYAEVTGEAVDEKLKNEFDEQYKLHNHSISDIFYSLGKPAGWWSQRIATIPPEKLFVLAENDIPEVLQKIRQVVLISIFSNINLGKVLPAVGIDLKWFTHILSSEMIKRPKPALDGFNKIVELSQLKPSEILYVGDNVFKDVMPAKKVGLQSGLLWNESDEADYNFRSFRDILEFVEK
ncbi:MAG: HAD family hydrolase [Patescibacteria group bacterium]